MRCDLTALFSRWLRLSSSFLLSVKWNSRNTLSLMILINNALTLSFPPCAPHHSCVAMITNRPSHPSTEPPSFPLRRNHLHSHLPRRPPKSMQQPGSPRNQKQRQVDQHRTTPLGPSIRHPHFLCHPRRVSQTDHPGNAVSDGFANH